MDCLDAFKQNPQLIETICYLQQLQFLKQLIQMNPYKRQSIQKLIIDQTGNDRLILNDLILGRDGAETLAALIPEYHPNLLHLQIKGNNIDAEGMEMVLMALMNCPNLVSIQAEWNNIGSSPHGMMALLYLVQKLRFLELVDLKNNKISHQLAELIAEIIKTNNRSLTVLDLRWNELGEVGAQIIYPALAFNSALKYIGLEDNRISSQTLLQITEYLKNPTRGTLSLTNNLTKTSFNRTAEPAYLPISDSAYPSMEVQMKTGQLRTKIQNQQQEAIIQQQKIQVQIQKVLQKIRVKGSQIHEAQTKYDFLSTENVNLINNLHEAERVFGIVKQTFFGVDKSLNNDKSSIRTEKYNVSAKMQIAMEKIVQRQQRQLEDLNSVMAQKYDRLKAYLKDRISEKRVNREKIAEIKEDIVKFRLSKESIWDKVTLSTVSTAKNGWEEQCLSLEEIIGKAEAAVKAERKKGEYLTEQLTNFVMRGLRKQEKYEQDIFEVQNKIKDLHKDMTLANVDIEESQCKIALKQAEIIDKEACVDLNRRYIKYIQSQSSVNLDIERLKNDEDVKGDRFSQQAIEMRICDLERALRQQVAQNKMLKNHYQKILSQLQVMTKNTIQTVLFQQ